MNKKLNQSAMDALMGGLTSPSQSPSAPISEEPASGFSSPQKSEGGKKPRQKSTKAHICSTVDSETWNKIQYISRKNAIPLNETITYAFDLLIERYEEKFGEIQIEKTIKGSVSALFD